ncbi:MAG: bifunctional proline dehydrogenase/L-glutamate gamma-semialdehyde dehydrogenase [Chlamydiia bacterium]|nr:bifunctional proline dehydrogenase/L-glutamate gamma-semialdehyde dehydrogenase [Chlamydiia bacterium]
MEWLKQAQLSLNEVKRGSWTDEQLVEKAIDLAACVLQGAESLKTREDRRWESEIAGMMRDPKGKAFAVAVIDECLRTEDPKRMIDQFRSLVHQYGIPRSFPLKRKVQLGLLFLVGSPLVNLFKQRLRQEMARIIMPGEEIPLINHIEKRAKEGVKVNLNRIGEAILGESEAKKRLKLYLEDLRRNEVECISVKISTLYSQLNLVSWEKTLEILSERLRLLYRTAKAHVYIRENGERVTKFVTLDMEEYRDLQLTKELFQRVLDEEEFATLSAGIVLQAYLPDSYPLLKELIAWSKMRQVPIKIRIVKGANLAMERVDASNHVWPLVTYSTKEEIDANFKRMLRLAIAEQGILVGVGSHNLFDIAYALILAVHGHVEEKVDIEMLEGMANPIRLAVQHLFKNILLYTPVAKAEEFVYAFAYLLRRFDENTARENFISHLFDLKPYSKEWMDQKSRFMLSALTQKPLSDLPKRTQDRHFLNPTERCCHFTNEADTDWSLQQNRKWIEQILCNTSFVKQAPLVVAGKLIEGRLATKDDVDCALSCAQEQKCLDVSERAFLLEKTAEVMRKKRGELIAVMVADGRKTIYEADPEISEAIDFLTYYRINLLEWHSMQDVQWSPRGVIVVTPPWNFPCSIPTGGIAAALATGNRVLFKPAPETVLTGWEVAKIFWEAGWSQEILQFVPCNETDVGNALISDSRVDGIILTGATETARHFLKSNPKTFLTAETGGKNSLIITQLADRDLAIRDLIHSAFGHAGQKCSACSLAIVEKALYDDPTFLSQLKDAVSSLPVGIPEDPYHQINPLIRSPEGALLRGLTQLEKGEEWLLPPKQDPNHRHLFSPGIKIGVREGSFTHQTELFGPVLGLMRAENLSHALRLANGTRYGLTAGIHTLDQREQKLWLEGIQAGNCYINRGITGAIVQRQPFGGCKESSFGPGAKAGGPNYLTQYMIPHIRSLPTEGLPPKGKYRYLSHLIETHFPFEQKRLWESCVGNYLFYWEYYFSRSHEPSQIVGQDNLLCYRPRMNLTLFVQPEDQPIDLLIVLTAANICKAPLTVVGLDPIWIAPFQSYLDCNVQDSIAPSSRIRCLQPPSKEQKQHWIEQGHQVISAPPVAHGRLELLHYLREVSISTDYHRYGNLGYRVIPDVSCRRCRR